MQTGPTRKICETTDGPSNGEHPHRETQEENGEALAFTQGDTRCKVCAHISLFHP